MNTTYNTTYIISHWDIDGIASAALIARSTNITKTRITKIRLSTISALTTNLNHALSKSFYIQPFTNLIISDLNPSPQDMEAIVSLLSNALDMGIKVYWIDHHVWKKEIIDALKSIGVKLYLDPSKVSAELVKTLIGIDDMTSNTLVQLARDDDLFLNRISYTKKLRRILRWYDWKIRYKVLKYFINGIIWNNMLERLYNQISEEYQALIKKSVDKHLVYTVKGLKIIVVNDIDPRVHPGEVQEEIEKRGLTADLYVFIYPTATSLRSNRIDVARIAMSLGGGGHPRAAGIPEALDITTILNHISRLI
ncbi:phosphohydrolase [Desulfurococcaceae archaeon MEX13E-LK6-19]|nr:phosphohydrolase [Desulfurococcaceae archaeon MEX13E-LK6-19]